MLEGPHLERVLGVALVALGDRDDRVHRLLHLGAVPRRPTVSEGFKDRAIERGAILFANKRLT